jgi:hypothetical protein
MVFRYLAVPTIKIAQQAIWLSGVSITSILSIVAYAGHILQLILLPTNTGKMMQHRTRN